MFGFVGVLSDRLVLVGVGVDAGVSSRLVVLFLNLVFVG